MSKKKFLLIIMLLFSLCFIGCKKIKKVIPVRAVGSTIYVGGYESKPYKIHKLNVESQDGYFLLEDYVVCDEGENFNIINSNGKIIGSINLIKKSELYSQEKLFIDLKYYNYDVIIIESYTNIVSIKGEPNMSPKELFICIESRTTPLDIYLENVNLTVNYIMPVIYNCSFEDVNIICKGTNYITGGSEVPPIELLELLETTKDIYTIVNSPFEVYSMAEDWVKDAIKKGIYNELTGEGTFTSGFYDTFYETTMTSLDLTKEWLNSLNNVVLGKAGVDGIDGVAAIQSLGGIAFYGEGTIVVTGGKGVRGTNATKGVLVLHDIKGGTGGDGGVAVMAYSIINMSNGKCSLIGGTGGSGGKSYYENGHEGYAQSGRKGDEVFADFYYSNGGE